MKSATDVLIIGGGIIGVSIAYALRQRGIDVMVVEKSASGMQTSRTASGLLAPLKPFAKPENSYTQLLLLSLTKFPRLVKELEDLTGISVEYEQTGTLRIRRSKETQRLKTWCALWQRSDFQMEVLTSDEVCQYEPDLEVGTAVAVYNPHEPQLNTERFVQAYARAAILLGTTFCTEEEVTKVDHRGTRIQSVQTAHGHRISCNHLVLATGAWSMLSQHWLGLTLPVHPLRGQSLLLRQPRRAIEHILFGEGIYLAPKRNGMLIVGTARDDVGFEIGTTSQGIARLYEAAKRLVPMLRECPIEQAWAGLLPSTPDVHPILGPCSWENVTLACGHNGYGLLLSATGDLIGEHILTGYLPEQLRPFLLERFF